MTCIDSKAKVMHEIHVGKKDGRQFEMICDITHTLNGTCKGITLSKGGYRLYDQGESLLCFTYTKRKYRIEIKNQFHSEPLKARRN